MTYIESGRQSVLKRAEEIVKQLNLTRENVELFEDCERISHEVVSYSFPSSEGGETLRTCRWVHSLHEQIYSRRLPKYLDAAKDVFSRLSLNSDVDIKEAVTAYHQLEQLVKEIGDEELALIRDENIRGPLKAVKRVHENNLVKKTTLKERYGLD